MPMAGIYSKGVFEDGTHYILEVTYIDYLKYHELFMR